MSNGKEYLSMRNLGYFRKFRHDECKELHPTTFAFGIKAQVAAAGEAALIYLLFKDRTNQIRVEWMDVFFEQERFWDGNFQMLLREEAFSSIHLKSCFIRIYNKVQLFILRKFER